MSAAGHVLSKHKHTHITGHVMPCGTVGTRFFERHLRTLRCWSLTCLVAGNERKNDRCSMCCGSYPNLSSLCGRSLLPHVLRTPLLLSNPTDMPRFKVEIGGERARWTRKPKYVDLRSSGLIKAELADSEEEGGEGLCTCPRVRSTL